MNVEGHAEGNKVRRVVGALFGAILAVGVVSGGVLGLSSGLASAATAEPTTMSLNQPSNARVTSGSESETFTGAVTGQGGDGYPKTGAVKIAASNGSTVCAGSLTVGSADAANYTCVVSTMGLPAGSYTVHAHYTGGTSSTTGHSYTASTSGTQSLKVSSPQSSAVTLNPITSPVTFGSEAQTFTGTVTGQAGDGYPTTGTVTVQTSTGVVLCTGSLTSGSGDAAKFTCDASTPSKLSAAGYSVHAHYEGGTSSSSTPPYRYRAATSATQSLTVAASSSKTPTVKLNTITSPVPFGSEVQTFAGTVTGIAGDGYPQTGAVTEKTSTNVVLCTGSLTEPGSGSSTRFTCKASTATKLAAGKYSVHAHYTGGTSSDVDFTYAAATSAAQTLTVTSGLSTTTTLSLNHTSGMAGAETSELLSVTVTGEAGDGYPKGTVTVETTKAVTVCSTSTRSSGTTDSSKFTCKPAASALAAGTYELTATYSPAASSSSTSAKTYAGSTSAKEKFTVTAGVSTTSALSVSSPSERSGSETPAVFTVKVTGKAGDGYPKGTVDVKTTGGDLVCTKAAAASVTTDTATYTCSPHASTLGTGRYTIVATFSPGTPSSSTTSHVYAASTSNSETFTVTAPSETRIYGNTPDATAAAELESVYPGTKNDCPGTTSSRPVVLSTDAHFPDALAASYLEKSLGTGMLLTPTSSITNATLTALRVEGITDVYVVGGPLAVSTAVVSEIQHTNAYDCGGTTRTGSFITVFRIYGQTQYTTAEDIAQTPGAGFVGKVDLQGAYGHYNDTTGRSSATPAATARKTAILASGAEFQDAEASATLAYADGLPLLLTTPTSLSPQALNAISFLGVTQVILMGGPLAVTNAVVTALVSHKVSVLRVAGVDYTDTADQLADLELGSTTGHVGFGWTPTHGLTVAQGHFFTDGLAGAIAAAHGGATGGGPEPMLLTESPTNVGGYLSAFLNVAGNRGIDSDGTRVTSLTVLGGPLALTTAVVNDMVADL